MVPAADWFRVAAEAGWRRQHARHEQAPNARCGLYRIDHAGAPVLPMRLASATEPV
jgi:hypothetical protein